MDKFTEQVSKIVPLLSCYPRWAQFIFAASFCLCLVSLFIFAVRYGDASAQLNSRIAAEAIPVSVTVVDSRKDANNPNLLQPKYTIDHLGNVIHQIPYVSSLQKDEPVTDIFLPEQLNIPKLDVKLTNNSGKTIFFDRIVVEAATSKPDNQPVPVFHTPSWLKDSTIIEISNVGHGNMTNCILRFNVRPIEEYRPDQRSSKLLSLASYTDFNEVLENEIRVPEITSRQKIKISDALTKKGLNLNEISSHGYRLLTHPATQTWVNSGAHRTEPIAYLISDYNKIQDIESLRRSLVALLGKYRSNQCLIYGTLTFSNENQQLQTIKFITTAYIIGQHGRFSETDIDATYDAQLRPSGSNYKVPVQISRSIKNGEVDRISIKVACEQSSTHRLRLHLHYGTNNYVSSNELVLHAFYPRDLNLSNEGIQAR